MKTYQIKIILYDHFYEEKIAADFYTQNGDAWEFYNSDGKSSQFVAAYPMRFTIINFIK